MPNQEIEVIVHNGAGSGAVDLLSEERVERLVALGRALSGRRTV